MIRGFAFRFSVQGAQGLRVQEFRVYGLGFRVTGFRVFRGLGVSGWMKMVWDETVIG